MVGWLGGLQAGPSAGHRDLRMRVHRSMQLSYVCVQPQQTPPKHQEVWLPHLALLPGALWSTAYVQHPHPPQHLSARFLRG